MSQTGATPDPLSCFQIPALSIPLLALINSGAEDRFLDKELALQSGLPIKSLDPPITLNDLDGKLLAWSTHHTAPLLFVLSGNHHAEPHLLPRYFAGVRLFLAEKTEPQIGWSAGRVMNWSPFCHFLCLKSALPTTVATIVSLTSTPPDLSTVPPEYHDLGEVFGKDRALSLPPYHLYACAINLLSGTALHSSHLYNLSCPEREAMNPSDLPPLPRCQPLLCGEER